MPTIKNKKIKSRKVSSVLIIAGLILAVSAVAGFLFRDTLQMTIADTQAAIQNQGKPRFVFDTAAFPDWASSGNVWVNPADITDYGGGAKEDLPTADISMQQCTTGSNCSKLVEKCRPRKGEGNECKQLAKYTLDTPCFVSVYYIEKNIDPSKAIADELKQWTTLSDQTPIEVGIQTLTMQTPEGNQTYQFHQYDTNSKDASYKRGIALGFVPLEKGHIEVRGDCWQASQLDNTLPILRAVSLTK